MCFSRRDFSREERFREVRKDPVWDLFDRERETDRPQPITDRERMERDADDNRDKVPAEIGAS